MLWGTDRSASCKMFYLYESCCEKEIYEIGKSIIRVAFFIISNFVHFFECACICLPVCLFNDKTRFKFNYEIDLFSRQ